MLFCYYLYSEQSLQRMKLNTLPIFTARLPPDLVKKLQMLLRSPTCVEHLQVLSSAILRESLPLSVHNLSTELSQDSRALGYLASVVLAQVLSLFTLHTHL